MRLEWRMEMFAIYLGGSAVNGQDFVPSLDDRGDRMMILTSNATIST